RAGGGDAPRAPALHGAVRGGGARPAAPVSQRQVRSRPAASGAGPMNVERALAAFGSQSGQLTVGGIPLERLAAQLGSTPFFAYDRELITGRVHHLRSTLPAGVELSYAIKANPMPAVVQHVAGLVDSLDVASAGEMRVALD